jgi:hypothetical protein
VRFVDLSAAPELVHALAALDPTRAKGLAPQALRASRQTLAVQNVGAYGVEVADTMTRVKLLERPTGEVHWVPAAELDFGYRHSALKNDSQAIVLEVEFALDEHRRSAPLRYAELAATLE